MVHGVVEQRAVVLPVLRCAAAWQNGSSRDRLGPPRSVSARLRLSFLFGLHFSLCFPTHCKYAPTKRLYVCLAADLTRANVILLPQHFFELLVALEVLAPVADRTNELFAPKERHHRNEPNRDELASFDRPHFVIMAIRTVYSIVLLRLGILDVPVAFTADDGHERHDDFQQARHGGVRSTPQSQKCIYIYVSI